MDIALLLLLMIGFIVLAAIVAIGFSAVVEVRKVRKEIVKILYLINQMNTTVIHQTSKLDILNKQLRIIGSRLAPEKYKRKTTRATDAEHQHGQQL